MQEQVYHGRVNSLPSERKALLFSAGGVRLALRLSQLREIVEVAASEGEVVKQGRPLPTAWVSTVLGLPGGPSRYALLTEDAPPVALRVETLHGIVDLGEAEVFQLPVHTLGPQPSPFAGALVVDGEVALELAVGSLGFAPLAPAEDPVEPPPSLGPWPERELRFSRGELVFGVPLSMVVAVREAPGLAHVPLAPPSHRGLLYHGRAIHPVIDVAVHFGRAPALIPAQVLVIDAGGATIGVVADRVLGLTRELDDGTVLRPPWDSLFGSG
jgi:chemotaxis signal transduction protein